MKKKSDYIQAFTDAIKGPTYIVANRDSTVKRNSTNERYGIVKQKQRMRSGRRLRR